jgi:hypothetical protein
MTGVRSLCLSRLSMICTGRMAKSPSLVWLYLAHHKIEKLGGRGSVYLQVPERKFKKVTGGIHRKHCSIPIPIGNQLRDGFEPDMVEGAFEIVSGIPNDYWESVEGLSVLDASKVAFDEFKFTVRVYMGRDNQSFFQMVNASLKVRNVMVGPFDFEASAFANGHD